MARSLNKILLIGNLTRDPELRYTPQGTAVCTFGLATNRQWVRDSGEKKEETEFHRVVAWNKLAEICSQLLTKGRKVYVEGRLQSRSWTAQDGSQKVTVEIVINDMIILDSRKEGIGEIVVPEPELTGVETKEPTTSQDSQTTAKRAKITKKPKTPAKKENKKNEENITAEAEKEDIEDIPF